jgi:hypothetical protein
MAQTLSTEQQLTMAQTLSTEQLLLLRSFVDDDKMSYTDKEYNDINALFLFLVLNDLPPFGKESPVDASLCESTESLVYLSDKFLEKYTKLLKARIHEEVQFLESHVV